MFLPLACRLPCCPRKSHSRALRIYLRAAVQIEMEGCRDAARKVYTLGADTPVRTRTTRTGGQGVSCARVQKRNLCASADFSLREALHCPFLECLARLGRSSGRPVSILLEEGPLGAEHPGLTRHPTSTGSERTLRASALTTGLSADFLASPARTVFSVRSLLNYLPQRAAQSELAQDLEALTPTLSPLGTPPPA